MTYNTPLHPQPLGRLGDAVHQRVMTACALRQLGVSAVAANGCCRPGGPWQLLLPGVYVLHAGPLDSEERLHGALLYATGQATEPGANGQAPAARSPIPEQAGPAAGTGPHEVMAASVPASATRQAMITGHAALALHRFASVPPLHALDHIDVLVPRPSRLRSAGCVRVVREGEGRLPHPVPVEVAGRPVAPVPRALAHALGRMADAVAVRRLLVESVCRGHCEPDAVVRELSRAGLLGRPHVADAVEALLAAGRALAEGLLHEMVSRFLLPDPFWNVELTLPDGARLGAVDAYWPGHAVAVALEDRAFCHGPDAYGVEYARRREVFERIGITLLHLTPDRLHRSLSVEAALLRTALVTAAERERAEQVIVAPR